MRKNRVKDMLKAGQASIGAWITIGNPDVAEIFSYAGFDWLLFDTEHSPLSIETLQHLIQAMDGTDTVPLVRVAWNDPVLIKRALDVGAYGIVVPWVNSKEDAFNAVRACRYPPTGIRGVGPRRASKYGLEFKDYITSADEEILVVVQIETETAVNKVEEIFSVDGVDASLIGPADLSTSLGVFEQWDHPKFQGAVKRILNASEKAGVAPGIVASYLEDANQRLAEGFKFVSVTSDIECLIQGSTQALKSVRQRL